MTDHRKRQEIPVGGLSRGNTWHSFTYPVPAVASLGPTVSTREKARELFGPGSPFGEDASVRFQMVTPKPGTVQLKADQSIRMPLATYLAKLEDADDYPWSGDIRPLAAKLRDALAVIELYRHGVTTSWTTERVDLVKSLEWIEVPL